LHPGTHKKYTQGQAGCILVYKVERKSTNYQELGTLKGANILFMAKKKLAYDFHEREGGSLVNTCSGIETC
jgi:hypothetical protein